MSNYINLEAAKMAIVEAMGKGHSPFNAIVMLPAADVAPVRHGKNVSESGFLCSVCGFGDFDGFHGYKPRYCPNCGASMREVEHE